MESVSNSKTPPRTPAAPPPGDAATVWELAPTSPDTTRGWRRRMVLVLFLTSGFTGLVYEILWMKQLALLFGNTAQAAATTLAAFFLGLAAGGYVLGRRAGGMRAPLRGYALLEVGVAVSALAYFALNDLYHAVYAPLFGVLGNAPLLFVLVKFLLGVGVLFPFADDDEKDRMIASIVAARSG